MFCQRFIYRFSSKAVPVVDVTSHVNKTGNSSSQCAQIAEALHNFGAVVIKDPRVNDQQNKDFLSMMENYFETRSKKLYAHQHVEDFFPQYSYQVGATPEYIEKARIHKDVVSSYTKGNEASTPQPPPFDAKWRFFWPIDDSGKKTKDTDFNPPRYTPKDVPNFENKMESWGRHMINGCLTVAEMCAIGLGIAPDTFTSKMKGGSHLLAPTGSDLERHTPGTVFAGFHYDLNFLTIHGKSRYPGLFVWLRNGERLPVAVPEGHLLLQAGSQFDLLTGGYITCGYHEVIYTDTVKQRVEENKKNGITTWRVSSTLFSHINPDVILQPVEKFASANLPPKYKPMKCHDQVQMELEAINLK